MYGEQAEKCASWEFPHCSQALRDRSRKRKVQRARGAIHGCTSREGKQSTAAAEQWEARGRWGKKKAGGKRFRACLCCNPCGSFSTVYTVV